MAKNLYMYIVWCVFLKNSGTSKFTCLAELWIKSICRHSKGWVIPYQVFFFMKLCEDLLHQNEDINQLRTRYGL